MKNYSSVIPLGDNKYAFKQTDESFRDGVKISQEILLRWMPPRIFYHHRKGGHLAAYKKHLSNSYFSHVDISRFFFSITRNKVLKSLKSIGIDFLSANYYSASSVVNFHGKRFLPYGFYQSQIIASLCLYNSAAGRFLKNAPKEICLSLYVDDILISSENCDLLKEYCLNLMEKIEESNYSYAAEKCEIAQPMVTAFNIEISQRSGVITADRMEKFRDFIRLKVRETNAVEAVLAYVGQVNADQYTELREYWRWALGPKP